MIMHILKSNAMERCLPAILSGMLLAACSVDEPPREQLSVSIEPLNFLTRQIAGDDFEINVLVPPAASPETYEPTPAQMKRVANSAAYVEIGLLDFEHKLERSIRENMPGVRIVRTADSVPVLTGEHGHGHDGHGTDPHIWTSPRNLRVMAATLLSQLESMYPDSTRYRENYERFANRMDSLDHALQAIFADGPRTFVIYHPALSYMARDYGLTQLAIEDEGKEPSGNHVRTLVDEARNARISRILYQRQFSRSTVEALASELKAETVAIDPLGYDIPSNLLFIAHSIAHDQTDRTQ